MRLAACVSALSLIVSGCGSSSPLPAPPIDIAVTFSILDGPADWVAFQDGDGPWVKLDPTITTPTQHVTDPAGRYAWAAGGVLASTSAGSPDLTAYYYAATTSETRQIQSSVNGNSMVQVSGTLTGFGPTDAFATVRIGDSIRGLYSTPSSPSFAFTTRPGTSDLVAVAQSSAQVPSGILVQRGISLTTDTVLPTIDLTQAQAPEAASVTITGTTLGEAVQGMSLIKTAGGTGSLLGRAPAVGGVAPVGILRAADRVTGDAFILLGTATSGSSGRSGYAAVAEGNTEVALPPALTAAASVQGAPLRASVTWSEIAGAQSYHAELYQAINGASLAVLASVTPGRRTTYPLVLPDFGALSGNPSLWGWAPGAEITWWLDAKGSSWTVDWGQSHTIQPGDRYWVSRGGGTLTP